MDNSAPFLKSFVIGIGLKLVNHAKRVQLKGTGSSGLLCGAGGTKGSSQPNTRTCSLRCAFAISILLAVPILCWAQVTITEYSVPINTYPYGITAGPDGNLWFADTGLFGVESTSSIGRMTTSGIIMQFSTPGAGPEHVTLGPDGNLWFVETYANKIGRITPKGVITEFPIPTSDSSPEQIVLGPDGNLWFGESSSNNVWASKIGRITTSGIITEFPLPTPGFGIYGAAAGPDGNLWFTQSIPGQIVRITTSGVITEFPLFGTYPIEIANGSDGNLWFTEWFTGAIGRITTAGAISEFPIPPTNIHPYGITAGPDGNLWFTEYFTDTIGRITLSGAITEFPIPTPNSGLTEIVTGPDGNLWFTEYNVGKIGKVTLAVSYAIYPLYDQTRAVKKGACYPIKVELDNGNGVNVSSPNITLRAVSVTLASNDAPGTLQYEGNANPDNDFRYDANLGGYIFNLSTAGLFTGTWNLNFTAGADPTLHTVRFQVK